MKQWILFWIALQLPVGAIAGAACDDSVFENKPKRSTGLLSTIRRFPKTLTFIAVVSVSIVLQPISRIYGSSMEPNLHNGKFIIVDRISLNFSSLPERGEIILFDIPVSEGSSSLYIKRVVALPGDRVQYDRDGLKVNGQEIQEPYLDASQDHIFRSQSAAVFDLTVPVDHIWVLGDNRAKSYDSREFGPIPLVWWRARLIW